MLSRDDLNPYSRRFAERLFHIYPAWEALAATPAWPNADAGSFYLEVPSPANPSRVLAIGTDGGEVTVGFGEHGWHTHYGEWTRADEESSFAEALSDVAGIIGEQLVIAAGLKDGVAGASTMVAVGDDPGLEGYDVIEYSSWHGTYDQSVPA